MVKFGDGRRLGRGRQGGNSRGCGGRRGRRGICRAAAAPGGGDEALAVGAEQRGLARREQHGVDVPRRARDGGRRERRAVRVQDLHALLPVADPQAALRVFGQGGDVVFGHHGGVVVGGGGVRGRQGGVRALGRLVLPVSAAQVLPGLSAVGAGCQAAGGPGVDLPSCPQSARQ